MHQVQEKNAYFTFFPNFNNYILIFWINLSSCMHWQKTTEVPQLAVLVAVLLDLCVLENVSDHILLEF